VEVDGTKLYYEECGTGPEAVVLIHDGIAHSAVWDDVWPTLCKRFHTIRYVSGFPYTDHFLDRGMRNSQPFEKGDVTGGLSNWAKDKYLLAPGHDAAKKRLLDLLTANPQDMTHSDYARPTLPALPRLKEIRIPTLILVGDGDIPDVHAHAGAIEAGIPGSKRVIIPETGHLMYLEKPEEFSRAVIAFIDANSP
jgi:pimeloyl-ACP methyl ester carboxylesterase